MDQVGGLISKKTPVTIGLVITLAGGVGWLTDMKFQGNANAQDLKSLKSDQVDTQKSIKKIEKWLSAIGQKLKVPEPRE